MHHIDKIDNLLQNEPMSKNKLDHIIKQYPDLFSADCLSISFCPEGWVHILEAFCDELDSYTKTYTCEKEKCLKNILLECGCWALDKAGDLIRPKNHIVMLFTPAPKKTFRGGLYDWTRKLWCKLTAKKRTKKVYTPKIKIDQFKEKFGGLRIYTNIYTDRVLGMTMFAETLSFKTCEITGREGVLCHRGTWYKTLSLDKAAEMGYSQCHAIKKQ